MEGGIGADFIWIRHPQVMAGLLQTFNQRVMAALHALADLFAQKMQSYAAQNAPWSDQSGNARQGLKGYAQKAALGVIIYLVHLMEYGIYLETGTYKMAARPIILPTLEAHYGEVMSAVRSLLAGI